MHNHTEHGHEHGLPADTGAGDLKKRFYIGIFLNAVFVALELGWGYMKGSMALIADAGHNLSDVLSLILALVAVYLGGRAATSRFSFGYGRSSILFSLVNGLLLLGASAYIALEALERLGAPGTVPSVTIMLVAGVGVIINGVSTLLFVKGSKSDLNVRGAFLHLAADALISLGVVLGGLLIYFTGWAWVDSVLSLLIVGIIAYSAGKLMLESLGLAMDAVPPGLDREEVQAQLESIPGVRSVHELHIRALSTSRTDLTAHLVLDKAKAGDRLLQKVRHDLQETFGIQHATLQIETKDLGCVC